MKRTLLIDADVIVYAVANSAQKNVRLKYQGGPEFTSPVFRHDQAYAYVRSDVEAMRRHLRADSVVMVLSSLEEYWRRDVLPTYKGNRAGTPRPLGFYPLREFIQEEFQTECWGRLEGDDVLGILATEDYDRKAEDRIVCSIDKDLRTIPGHHFNWGKKTEFTVNHQEAQRMTLFQALTGDATDGYKGCPGVGPVKANRILDMDCTFSAVQGAYRGAKDLQKRGLSDTDCDEMALQMYRCARILRVEDYDRKTGEITLWTPSKSDW